MRLTPGVSEMLVDGRNPVYVEAVVPSSMTSFHFFMAVPSSVSSTD